MGLGFVGVRCGLRRPEPRAGSPEPRRSVTVSVDRRMKIPADEGSVTLRSPAMRKKMPVRECMSHLPAETDRGEPLSVVVRQMREQNCHHISIMDGPRVYGILSRHDLHELALRGGKSTEDLVAGDVCTRDP